MKKFLALLLALTMVFALVACGGETTTEPTTEPTETTTETGFVPKEAEWENGKITVVGAEAIEDLDGKDAFRVYYVYENTTEESTYADANLEVTVTQNGKEADYAYAAEDGAEYGNEFLRVRPGAAVLCYAEYAMKANGGEIVVNFTDYWSEAGIGSVTFDPANLPGRPADFVIEPIADPLWTEGMPTEGLVDEDGYYVAITTAEYTEDYDGAPAIRIYFQFTNDSAEETSLWFGTSVDVYQDGVELNEASPSSQPSEGIGFYDKVQPGETAVVSSTYRLRSDSPVEVEILDAWGDGGIGCVFA